MELKNATILLVDDEAELLNIFAEWMEREGCRVLTASDGADALQQIRSNAVDVVITDVRMPGMDGIELVKRINENGKYKPYMIFISGFSDIDERAAYDMGVEAFLPKPVERMEMVSVLRRILADRVTLWSLPPAVKSEGILNAEFDSIPAARSLGQIAFGRGGFCIHSAKNVSLGPADILLKFMSEKRTVSGNAVVRWISKADSEIGLEIMYIDDENRGWFFGLTEKNNSHSFIPRTAKVTP